jgi:hypothetical protein
MREKCDAGPTLILQKYGIVSSIIFWVNTVKVAECGLSGVHSSLLVIKPVKTPHK